MKKITLCLMLILALILVPVAIFAQTVSTQTDFIAAVNGGNSVEINKDLTIKLEGDITIKEKIQIGKSYGSNVTLTLDLNGYKVVLDGNNAQLFTQKKGTLIIEDSVGTGLITNEGSTATSPKYPIQIAGNCVINGGTIENTLQNLYTIHVQKDATCTLNDGIVKNSYEKGGRAVNISVGTFTMNGGKVENKAAGSDGLTSAIEGHKIIITGGTIEAAGTGITATGSSVEITGGTIKAGWFGLRTRYANINPAEGKEISVSAGRALIIAYSTPTSGKGNEIYGGNFEAPKFMETGYVCDPENMKIYGGTFTHEVPDDLVAPGYKVNKVDNKYTVELNIPNIVDDELEVDDEVEMEIAPEVKEQLNEIFENEIAENKEIQDALLEGKEVDIHVQLKKVEEEDIKEELEEIKETAKDKEIAKIYDITLVVKVDGTQVDTISETSSKLKFKVLIPEELIKEGRTFFMYRYHEGANGGEVEELTGEVDKDNYFVFESDKFSTYVLAYEDKVDEPSQGGQGEAEKQPEEDKKDEVIEEDKKDEVVEEDKKDEVVEEDKKVETPKTGDNIVAYAVFAVFAVVAISSIVAVKKNRKE